MSAEAPIPGVHRLEVRPEVRLRLPVSHYLLIRQLALKILETAVFNYPIGFYSWWETQRLTLCCFELNLPA